MKVFSAPRIFVLCSAAKMVAVVKFIQVRVRPTEVSFEVAFIL